MKQLRGSVRIIGKSKPFAMIESEVILQCQRNNKEAQRTLFESHFEQFMLVCMRYSKNENEAQEMLNYSYAQLLHELSDFAKEEIGFDEWAKGKLIEHAVEFLKSKKNEYYVATTVRVTDTKASHADLFNSISAVDESEPDGDEILRALQSLPPSFRATYNMHMIDGFDFKKTGDYLEISEDTARFNFEKASYQISQSIQQYHKGY